MIREGADELICDFAQYYHMNLRENGDKLSYLATLAIGLPDDSRIKMKISGREFSTDAQLSGIQIDLLQYLVWFQTKDGQKNRNRPKPIFGQGDTDKQDLIEVNTSEQLMQRIKAITDGK